MEGKKNTNSSPLRSSRHRLNRIWERGIVWKPAPAQGEPGASPAPVVFRLDHGREVESDGSCLFIAARTAAAAKADERELRHRAVRRFTEVYATAEEGDRDAVDAAVHHLYAPDLKAGWVASESKLSRRCSGVCSTPASRRRND